MIGSQRRSGETPGRIGTVSDMQIEVSPNGSGSAKFGVLRSRDARIFVRRTVGELNHESQFVGIITYGMDH